MVERDQSSRHIHISGQGEAPDGVHEEIVCYLVVSGRGKALVRHLRDQRSRSFASRLVASYRGFEDIRALIEQFDETEWLDRDDRRHARAEMVRAIRKIVHGVPSS